MDDQVLRFYYNSAPFANAITIDAMAKLVPKSQIVFTGAEQVQGLIARFGATPEGN
jgi:hypothetical protein